jgi:hypothetical protein
MAAMVLFDAFFYGLVAFWLVRLIFGNTPIGRALSVVASIFAGYRFLAWGFDDASSSRTPDWLGMTLLLGPPVVSVMLIFLRYVFGGQQKPPEA